MMLKKSKLSLQPYARIRGELLAAPNLFPIAPKIDEQLVKLAINNAFQRSKLGKKGAFKKTADTPKDLVNTCIKHLKERSDPILSTYFVSQCAIDDLFELDAVSHEMQRHRMSIGIFYQYLFLELLWLRFKKSFDGFGEDDIVIDIDTPPIGDHTQGLRLYMSVKKSSDTVGGQDIGGVIRRLENRAKQEKNLTRPYLCVICIATPQRGKIYSYDEDRKIKYTKDGSPYSMNCETWGPGFIYPYITGYSPNTIYTFALKEVAKHLPFKSMEYKEECSMLLKKQLIELNLLNSFDKIDPDKFLAFCSSEKTTENK